MLGLPSGGRHIKGTQEKLSLHVEEENPVRVNKACLCFTLEGRVTKELAIRKVCSSLSPVFEEETLSLLLKKSR